MLLHIHPHIAGEAAVYIIFHIGDNCNRQPLPAGEILGNILNSCMSVVINWTMLGHFSAGFTPDTCAHVTTPGAERSRADDGDVLSM